MNDTIAVREIKGVADLRYDSHRLSWRKFALLNRLAQVHPVDELH